MAVFNPEVKPTNDPNYTSATRPISIPDDIRPQGVDTNRIMPKGQEIGDRSAEFEGRAKGAASQAQGMSSLAFGDLFAGVAAAGDFLGKAGVQMVRKDIENQVYEVADAERQRYTQILQSIRDGGGVKNILAGDSGDSETPYDIRNLPDQLSVLSSARDAGKLRSTDYRARILALAKDLRAKYPGFKTEIDQEFIKVTGMNPANAVLTGLIADINSQGHGAASAQNKMLSYIFSHQGDFDDPAEAARKVQSGEWGMSDFLKQTAPREKLRANIADRAAVWGDQKLSDEARIKAGGQLIDVVANGIADDYVNKFMARMGIGTEEQARAMEIRSKNGGIPAQEWQRLGQTYGDGLLIIRKEMWDKAQAAGLVEKMGADKVREHIDTAMKRVQTIGERIYAQDVGGIHDAANTVKAMRDDDVKNALEDDIIGGPLRTAMLARFVGGDQFMADTRLKQATEGLDGKWGAYGKSMQEAILAQKDYKTTGVPLTLNRVFDAYSDKMKNASEKEKGAVVNSTLNRILSIADPKTPDAAKLNYALAAFSPDRRSFIERLNQDSNDSRGREKRGQNAVFQDMSSEAMTKSMYELDKKHPGVFKMYTDWVTETLGNVLISRDVRELNQVRNPTVHIGWDVDNKRFTTQFKESPAPQNPEATNPFTALNNARRSVENSAMNLNGRSEEARVAQIVNRINNNLSGFKHIAKISGADVDAYVLRNIAAAAGPEALAQVDNLPAEIIRQLGLAKLREKNGANSNR